MQDTAPDTAANEPEPQTELTTQRALAIAWGAWLVMLIVPFLLLLLTVAIVLAMGGDSANDTFSIIGAIVTGLWMMIGLPLAFYVRDRMFQGYWDGTVVPPATYLRGMLTIWIALEIGGILAIISCLISATFMPGLLLAAVAGMFFFTMWPNGTAMTDTVGNVADDQVFHHPR